MRTMLFVIVLLSYLVWNAMFASAGPYFRPIDLAHPEVSAGFLISPKVPMKTAGVMDLALITHSPTDGSVIPEPLRKWVPPVAWSPLSVGAGGSMKKEFVVSLGSSANISPAVAKLLMRGVDSSSSGWAKAIKSALEGHGPGQIRLGGALAGELVQDGVFKSAKQMFPGRGVGEIIGNAARLNVGAGWKF